MSKFDFVDQALVMMDRPEQLLKHRRLKFMAATFAVVGAIVTAQELVLADGTRLQVELSTPPRVHCLLRRDNDLIEVKSLHFDEREALERMALMERSESGEKLQ